MKIEVRYENATPNLILERKIRDMIRAHLGAKQYCRGSSAKLQEQYMWFDYNEKKRLF